ncbi:replication endonuclease [Rheinheimera faecalis]
MLNFQHSRLNIVMQNMDTEHGAFFSRLHRDDRLFVQEQVENFPNDIQRLLVNRYRSRNDRVKANIELRETSKKLEQLLPPVLRNYFNSTEDEFRELAQEFADICRLKAHFLTQPTFRKFRKLDSEKVGNSEPDSGFQSECFSSESQVITMDAQKRQLSLQTTANTARNFSRKNSGIALKNPEIQKLISERLPENEVNESSVNTEAIRKRSEIESPVTSEPSPDIPQLSGKVSENSEVNSEIKIGSTLCQTKGFREFPAEHDTEAVYHLAVEQAVYSRCADFVASLGLPPPTPDNGASIGGCIKRMQDKGWWLRSLRKVMVRKTEECMLHLNKVHKFAGIYCSDTTAANRKLQKARQLKMLESISFVNEHDQHYSLREIYDLNISNPINRRNELMTRMRGFEDIAKELGHIGDFITLTCPSKYHCAYARSGDRNPNWQGFTPHQSQQYLCGVWAKIRAELDRQEIRIYGLRVAEPQHDGTPHWHLMLFIEPEHLQAFRAVITRYSFEEDGDEAGARENRVKFVAIDPNKGSATGYVAKYICKNIDGANLDEGVYGENPIEAAERVEAWASCWGIRQFQQIGGVSVTVWRELRRLRNLQAQDATLTSIHQAADLGDWKNFVTLMGGVFCKRKEQAVRPHYNIEVDANTGEISTDYFDGFVTTKLKGICYLGQAIITRLHKWRIEINRAAFRSHLEFCK